MPKAPKAPSLSELLAELEAATRRKGAEDLGTKGWAAEWGVSVYRARELIRFALAKGRMRAENVQGPDVLRPGRSCVYTVYRFVERS